jgi:hypothetical protein
VTPEQALALAKAVSDVYGDSVTVLLRNLARLLARGIDRPDWHRERLAETARLRENSARIVAAMQQHGTQEVLRVLEEAYRGGRLTPLTSPGMTAVNQRSVTALAQDTIRALNDTTPRVLRWTDDVYRQVISEAVGPTVTGVADRREAAARALDRFTAMGVDGFRDTAGRNWRLESYTEMATRTATGRAHLAGTLDRYQETGVDLVIVSDSPQECGLCRPFEGKILSLSGRPPRAGEIEGHTYAGTHADAIAAGLHHPNCTHRVSAFTPGLTKPFDRETQNPKGYEDRQRARELERRVRESRRRVAVLEELGDTAALRHQKALLGRRRRDLSAHNALTGGKQGVSDRRSRLGPL